MRRALPALAAMALPLALGACISVFPKAKPVQMYRFGDNVAAPAQPLARPMLVAKGTIDFAAGTAGDRILTTRGTENAYIGQVRWTSPAALMFDAALLRAFDQPGSPRLVERGEPLVAPCTLRLDVRSFEASYPGPSALVRVRATLIRNADRTEIAEKMFEVSTPASDNRQAPIVAAFDVSVSKVIGDIRDWTSQNAPAASAR